LMLRASIPAVQNRSRWAFRPAAASMRTASVVLISGRAPNRDRDATRVQQAADQIAQVAGNRWAIRTAPELEIGGWWAGRESTPHSFRGGFTDRWVRVVPLPAHGPMVDCRAPTPPEHQCAADHRPALSLAAPVRAYHRPVPDGRLPAPVRRRRRL